MELSQITWSDSSFHTGSLCTAQSGSPWLSGQVMKVSSPESFEVKLTDGQIVRCHQDHLRKHTETTESAEGDSVSELLVSDRVFVGTTRSRV